MQKFKGTKGPWHTDKQDNAWIIQTGDYSKILSTPVAETEEQDEENKRNILLAKSAPYLLESLQELVAILESAGAGQATRKAKQAINMALTED